MLSREIFVNAYPDKPIDIPEAVFGPPPERDERWPDFPDLRRAVDWLKSFMTAAEWRDRRAAAFRRLIEPAYGLAPRDQKGRFFDDKDTFGWYRFLADAFLDHIWNYEPMFGSRVVPLLAAIGRNLTILQAVTGLDERVRRMVGPDRGQPNGALFELLVAAAYGRAGAQVLFRPERPGMAKTHDMDIILQGRKFAIECKRLEIGEYGESERARMRELWGPVSDALGHLERSTFVDIRFSIPVMNAPLDYLASKAKEWLTSGRTLMKWKDGISEGAIRTLDLSPLQSVLQSDDVLTAGTRTQELLSGRYIRHANYLQALRIKHGMTPRHMTECDLAIVLRWESASAESIDAKARDVLKRVAAANRQLPLDTPGVIHIGFEAVEGDDVERARYNKILASTGAFDPEGKPLEYVYCHYLVPESPPDQAWAFDETVQWRRITGNSSRPLKHGFLVLPDEHEGHWGTHWQS
jgi:hypothetical protein